MWSQKSFIFCYLFQSLLFELHKKPTPSASSCRFEVKCVLRSCCSAPSIQTASWFPVAPLHLLSCCCHASLCFETSDVTGWVCIYLSPHPLIYIPHQLALLLLAPLHLHEQKNRLVWRRQQQTCRSVPVVLARLNKALVHLEFTLLYLRVYKTNTQRWGWNFTKCSFISSALQLSGGVTRAS